MRAKRKQVLTFTSEQSRQRNPDPGMTAPGEARVSPTHPPLVRQCENLGERVLMTKRRWPPHLRGRVEPGPAPSTPRAMSSLHSNAPWRQRWSVALMAFSVACTSESSQERATTEGGGTVVDSGSGTGTGTGSGSDSDSDSDSGSSTETGSDGDIVVVPVDTPPSYSGGVDNSPECSESYRTEGFRPNGPGPYPLFLYFSGTAFGADDAAARFDSESAAAVTQEMARQGYFSVSVEYDNSVVALLSDHENQLRCLFDQPGGGDLLTTACGRPDVDCNLGIATWGHSQGALVAHAAADFSADVRAVWATGYRGAGKRGTTLPFDRFRLVNGEADADNAAPEVLASATGLSPDCALPGESQCLRPDGSGWIIVRADDCVVSGADHCWFDRASCTSKTITLEPSWVDPESTAAFALHLNAEWLARTGRIPR